MRARWLLVAASLVLLAAAPYRYSRSLEAKPGWAALELPDEVLARARPALADLRIEGPEGEIAYARESQLDPAAQTLSFQNVERARNQETSALLDRGERPALLDRLQIHIAGPEPFLKPAVLEASDDRKTYREIARGSIFRVAGAEATTMRFAPNDRRYLRLRLDDRNSQPVDPERARLLRLPAGGTERVLALEPIRVSHEAAGADVYALQLPARNLEITALRFTVADPAFSRRVAVHELVAFRDRLTRRLVAEGSIERGASGPEQLSVPLGEVSAPTLEVEIERRGPALVVKRVEALVRPTRLVFFAPERGALELVYGSERAEPPSYDLLSALRRGLPAELSPATLGPERAAAEPAPTIAPPTRSALAAPERWRQRRPILLPAGTTVAYLDLPSRQGRMLDQIRIVDARGRQVPYLVESDARSERRAAAFELSSQPGKSTLTVRGIDPREQLRSIELRATAPRYFSRALTVFESTRDRRGATGRRVLGSAHWTREPDQPERALQIVLQQPTAQELVIEIDDGDNPPLGISALELDLERRRIDFVFEPGDRLALLSDNPEAGAPRYDFALLAGTVLDSPALAATLGPAASPPAAPAERADKRWLWAAIALAALLVVLVLARTLREQKA